MKVIMKKLTIFTLAMLFSLLVFHSCNEPLTEEPVGDELTLKSASAVKSYIVVLNDDDLNTELANLKGYEKKQEAMKSASDKILKRAGISDGQVEHVYGTAIKGFSVKIAPGQLKKLQDDPSVKYIEEDQIITLIEPVIKPSKGKPGGGGGGGGTQPAEVTPWGITRVGGGATYTGNEVAWIIDTGIDQNHPDLNVDSERSQSFLSGREKDNPDDQNGHGTHVAGTIAAIDNEIGVVGVAAGATVISVRVLDRSGSGSTSGVIAGVDYVAASGSDGDVANMSLGGGFYQPLNDAVITAASKGIKFALAAGNESTSATLKSPASANGPNVYTISAMDINNNWAYFSNYGNPPVDFCAPGYSIYSTWKDGGYNTISGTSMAAPHAAGVLLWGKPNSSGTVNGDPDKNPDPIIHL